MKWAQNSNLLQVSFEFLLNFEVFAIFQVFFEFLHFTSRLAYFGAQTSSPAPAEPPKPMPVFRHGKWDSFVNERKRIMHLGKLLHHQRSLAPPRSRHFGCANGFRLAVFLVHKSEKGVKRTYPSVILNTLLPPETRRRRRHAPGSSSGLPPLAAIGVSGGGPWATRRRCAHSRVSTQN